MRNLACSLPSAGRLGYSLDQTAGALKRYLRMASMRNWNANRAVANARWLDSHWLDSHGLDSHGLDSR
jgi:hypothetical protein